MARPKSSTRWTPEREAALGALTELAGRLPTDVLIAAAPLLSLYPAGDGPPLSARSVARLAVKLRLLRQWAWLRASPDMAGVPDVELAELVCVEARHVDATVKVSPRSIRRWRNDYNRIGPGGLAAGPVALLDKWR